MDPTISPFPIWGEKTLVIAQSWRHRLLRRMPSSSREQLFPCPSGKLDAELHASSLSSWRSQLTARELSHSRCWEGWALGQWPNALGQWLPPKSRRRTFASLQKVPHAPLKPTLPSPVDLQQHLCFYSTAFCRISQEWSHTFYNLLGAFFHFSTMFESYPHLCAC